MRLSSYGLVLLMLVGSGCTFYTSCPPAGNNNGNGSAGSDGTGGSGNPGTGGGQSGGPPLLEGEWVNVTSNLAGLSSECGNLSHGTAKPDEDLIIMGVAKHGLWGSRNGGDSWEQLGSDSDPEEITNRASGFLWDPDDSQVFWESGIYNGSGIFKTTDDGASFEPLRIMHVDHVSADFTDPARKTMLASGHEQVHKLYLSTDSGTSWKEIGDSLPKETQVCAFPHVIDSHTFLLGCGSYSGGKTGIWRSTDAGATWEPVSDLGGGSAPLITKDGTIYWGSEGFAGLTKSTDEGRTWSNALGAGVVIGVSPWELPDGRIAELGGASILVSADEGVTWLPASAAYPYQVGGFFYSAQQGAFFVYHLTCNVGTDAVPADGVMRYDFDYETQ